MNITRKKIAKLFVDMVSHHIYDPNEDIWRNKINFYPRPVLAFGYCRCLCVCVCVCVCVSINHELVRTITHQLWNIHSFVSEQLYLVFVHIVHDKHPYPILSHVLFCWNCPVLNRLYISVDIPHENTEIADSEANQINPLLCQKCLRQVT